MPFPQKDKQRLLLLMEPINLTEKQQNICLSQKKVVPLRAFCCKIESNR